MKKGITAKELMDQLRSDPEFVLRERAKEEARRKAEARAREEEEPLAKDLRAVGIQVDSAWDLVPRATPYPEAIPILLEHLQRPYTDGVREGIARALAVPEPEVRHNLDLLVRLYRQEAQRPGIRVQQGLACAIAVAASEDTLRTLIELAKDASLGSSRGILLAALDESNDPRAEVALVELAEDPELHKEVHFLLRRKARRRGRTKGGRSN